MNSKLQSALKQRCFVSCLQKSQFLPSLFSSTRPTFSPASGSRCSSSHVNAQQHTVFHPEPTPIPRPEAMFENIQMSNLGLSTSGSVTESDCRVLSEAKASRVDSFFDKFCEPTFKKDPYEIVSKDLDSMNERIRNTVSTSDHAVMDQAAKYYFMKQGKQFRPMITLLMSKACATTGQANDSQLKLAEITEMIHTASLVHDDVIDVADTRRGGPSTNVTFGNKVAVLAGDFLLARSSIELCRIGNIEVIGLMSQAIEHLAVGEVLQMTGGNRFLDYMQKTFYKTASLLANSIKAAAVLGDHDSDEIINLAFTYGKHLGIAFQLVDDILDFTGTSEGMGKPVAADLSLGLATAPVLFAVKEFPELGPMMERRFTEEGDTTKALSMVLNSTGIAQAQQLAMTHSLLAIQAARKLAPSDARSALINLAGLVLTRQK